MDTPRPIVVRTLLGARTARSALTGRVALVMTMGALHDGHLSLVREAAGRAEHVVVSVYVNPLQFDDPDDLERYPRDLDADLDLLAGTGLGGRLAYVLAPDDAEMYPREPLVRIDPGPVAAVLEGATRPGHFAGVLQVVTKVLATVRPDVAVFGQKDAQQLALVRTLVDDLSLGTEIVGAPIRREDDGLAMSSRNAHLSATERERATALVRALTAGEQRAAAGASPAEVLATARGALEASDGVVPDYLVLVDPATFLDVDPDHTGEALLAVAARVGATRLIDNLTVHLAPRKVTS
ncbi:pantoate--beta-alanine ligase [Georgenia sp. Z1344]|uniref:pantoate--beta-alanine ligase n=1 Tax=Georgenia sp. Z1344 TaxID=3416706 RepID=UPI003CF31AFF